ncbi:hypothetical protein [Thiohalobacter thiocyanaticus]|uniref:Sulfotransferase n=1 Tax=Thiohalobacter thiocyanaticus TaxID=585455 RepID=A0A426QL91_9GAMM|nr:hypothetical protein [Thiohalobacter thiocyanaticus]RRQ22528.1 hypothetical protein D6C00_11665 [Thiohalobacter thiocyanaticus]
MSFELEIKKIERPIGIVVSGGRTATAFLGKNLSQVFADAAAFHEPDAVHHGRIISDIKQVVPRFGFYRGGLGKLLGRTGLRTIGESYIAGKLNDEEAAREIVAHRSRFYARQTAKLVIESNYAFYALLPVLPRVFENYKVVAIVRDPETWIRSYLNKDDRYGSKDYLDKLGLRISPKSVGDKDIDAEWQGMKTEERLAWFWRLVYQRIADASDTDPNIRVFRFEDLFYGEERESSFLDMARFLGDFLEMKFHPQLQANLLDQIENAAPPP